MACGGSTGLGMSALTWGDILGCLRSVAAFAAVLLAPGYCLAWACNLLGFRARAAGERLAWGVALSFGGMTIVALLLGKYGSLTTVCWLAGICALGYVGIVAREGWSRRRVGFASRWWLVGAGIAVAWVLFVVFELVDIGVGSRLYFSVTVFDHALRTAFVDAPGDDRQRGLVGLWAGGDVGAVLQKFSGEWCGAGFGHTAPCGSIPPIA